MAYSLKSVTLRTDNSELGMKKVTELWSGITSGKLPLMFDSDGNFRAGALPVSVYDNYDGDEKGEFDLTVTLVEPQFFSAQDDRVKNGEYIKIEKSGASVVDCANAAWQDAWAQSHGGEYTRAFDRDYEYTVPPEYSQDGKAHCVLYISVK